MTMKFKNVLDIKQEGENPFAAILRTQTEEQKQKYRKRHLSKSKAEEFFTRLFGEKVSWVIVANVMADYTTTFRKSAATFEEAWDALGYETTMDILFRAVNKLPCKDKDQGELESYLAEGSVS